MSTTTPARGVPAHLGPAESDIAGRAVFAWALVPAAGRLVHDLADGRDPHAAVNELRAAVRLLDLLGWPEDESGVTPLNAEDASRVRAAAEAQMGCGLDPDGAARARVARGHAVDPPRRGSVRGLLDVLEAPHR